ncbi:hypothetical protein [Streptococcus acidominimus]
MSSEIDVVDDTLLASRGGSGIVEFSKTVSLSGDNLLALARVEEEGSP